MPKRNIESELETLKSLRQAKPGETAILALRQAFSDRVNLIVAKAATVTAELQLAILVPDLLKTFERLLENGAETDPKCWAKEAITKALTDMGHSESAVFLRGLRHVQMEPIWGKHVDTAATLRATCVLALLQCGDLTRKEKLWHIMRALTDPEGLVRTDAIRALEEMEGIEAALLLGLKARMGDREAAVTGQALESLLGLEGEPAIPFVAEFMATGNQELAEEAALALGTSRLPGAVSVLLDAWNTSRGQRIRNALLRGIGASRQEHAIEFLLDVVRNGKEYEAAAALQALELYRDSSEIRKQIAEISEARGGAIREQFQSRFARE